MLPIATLPPAALANCMNAEGVATSPCCANLLRGALLPAKSPLLKGERASCTYDSAASGSDLADDGATAGPAPAAAQHEVTQGPPQWLEGLFNAELFMPCPCHPGARKNECNFYCLSCTPGAGRGMCKYCLADHKGCGGTVFQIRKYMYQTCVHVEDLQHLTDTTGCQAYCINGKRAVLIHPKVMAPGQQCPVFDNTCGGCGKPLRSDCRYCSLRCKVDAAYGRAPRTPEATALEAVQHRAPMTTAALAAAAAAAPQPQKLGVAAAAVALAAAAAADSEAGSARSSCSHWTAASRSKKRKADHPTRSFLG